MLMDARGKFGKYDKVGKRPFAGSSHMVRNKLHWDANDGTFKTKELLPVQRGFLLF